MSEDFRLFWKISLEQRALHELAKLCWGNFVSTEIIHEKHTSFIEKTKLLLKHRDEVLNKLPQTLNAIPRTFSTEYSKRIVDKIINAVIQLHEGYIQAVIWETKCQSSLPFTVFNPLTAGKYYAGNFLIPTSYFNDFAWAKEFIFDEKQSIHYRFELACMYCLEDEISRLWHCMKIHCRQSCKGRLHDITSNSDDLVGLWAYKLENKLHGLFEDLSGFNIVGVNRAIIGGHYYAAKFFWRRCSIAEKSKFRIDFDIDDIAFAAEYHHATLVHYLYNILSLAKCFDSFWNFEIYEGSALIWSCLLESQFYESVLNDILTFPIAIPTEVYGHMFSSLILKLKVSRNPIHSEIFNILWKHMSENERMDVIKKDFCIIESLLDMKAFDRLEHIIQTLSLSDKENILINKKRYLINEFSRTGDMDKMLRFFLCFLIDRNSRTYRMSVTSDAHNFLNGIRTVTFTDCNRNLISKLVKKQIDKLIDILQGCLLVIDHLLEHIKNDTIRI